MTAPAGVLRSLDLDPGTGGGDTETRFRNPPAGDGVPHHRPPQQDESGGRGEGPLRFVNDGVARAIRTLRAATIPAADDRVVPLSPQMVGLRFNGVLSGGRVRGVRYAVDDCRSGRGSLD